MVLYSKVILKKLFIPSTATIRIRAIIWLFAPRDHNQGISALKILNQRQPRRVLLYKIVILYKYNFIYRSRFKDNYTSGYISKLGEILQYRKPRGLGEVNILFVINIIRRYTCRPFNINGRGLSLSVKKHYRCTRR